jgi:hypothetical protein
MDHKTISLTVREVSAITYALDEIRFRRYSQALDAEGEGNTERAIGLKEDANFCEKLADRLRD